MKIKNAFGLFLVFTFFVTAVGVFPVVADTADSPMLVKGPQAVLANVCWSDIWPLHLPGGFVFPCLL